jgi:hypothetical protein
MVRTIEQRDQVEAKFQRVVDHERVISPALRGRRVFRDPQWKPAGTATQLSLFQEVGMEA